MCELNKDEIRIASHFYNRDLPFCGALERSRAPAECTSCGAKAEGYKFVRTYGAREYSPINGLCEGCGTIAHRWDELVLSAYEEEGPSLEPGGIASWLQSNDIDAEELVNCLDVDEDYAEAITGGEL